ncbi:hypothetical protein HID58_094657 [Brassica napus]|uniref:Uncharacterized protein n=1 Tax=Brassica napus TaxID=3708 RepID=A0ABQ7X6E1_BRANA|nr:hypothetical protein HID58_094657 [Brassica napus]
MNVCEDCGHYLKRDQSERIELSIDPGTWNPMDEDMVSAGPIQISLRRNLIKAFCLCSKKRRQVDLTLFNRYRSIKRYSRW